MRCFPVFLYQFGASGGSKNPVPYDPPVLKILRIVNFATVNLVRTQQNATERPQKCLLFSKKNKAAEWCKNKEKTTAVAKYYGFRRRSIFSTEGSFGFTD